MPQPPLGLYIHVPFCYSKCPYCDFFSVASSEHKMDMYTTQVCKALVYWRKQVNHTIDTIYFGGGTPSVLGTTRLLQILDMIHTQYTVDKDCEITLEVNPTTGKALDFDKLKSAGLNRISMGVQSGNISELKHLGRRHSNEDVIKTVTQLKKANIDNYSMDLILGVEGQTKESLLQSIQFCTELGCKHISAYILKIEEGTPYDLNKEKLNLPDEDEQIELYLFLCDTMEKLGYAQYEISNFSKKGYESKHNLKYWNCAEYLGIGPSAHSFLEKKRFYYPRTFSSAYQDDNVFDTMGGDEAEYAMLRLRLAEGLEEEAFKKMFKKNIPSLYYERCKPYVNAGYVHCDKKGIRFTPKGFLVSNALISSIISLP